MSWVHKTAVPSDASLNFMASHIYHTTHLSRGFIGESAMQSHASLNFMVSHNYHTTHLSRGFTGESAVQSHASLNFMVSHNYHTTHLSRGFIGESAVQFHASLNSFILETGLITRSRSGLWSSDENSSPAWHQSCTQNIHSSHRMSSRRILLHVTNSDSVQLWTRAIFGNASCYGDIFEYFARVKVLFI
jgi:hypothetical protein